MKKTRNISIILLILAMLPCQRCLAQSSEELFTQANQAYEKRDYNQAITLYEKIVNQEVTSASVFYNLGNAYFKTGKLAKAILYYEKAKLRAPRDSDIDKNLTYARQQTKDKIEDPNKSIFVTIIRIIHDYLTLDEWTIVVVILFNLFWLCIIVRMLIRPSLIRDLVFYAMTVIIFFLVIASLFFAFKIDATLYTENCVIMIPQTEVRSGPSTTYTVLLKIHSGTRAEITQHSNDWVQIRLKNGYQGWITQSAIELI